MKDTSSVAALAAKPALTPALEALGLHPPHVARVFEAISARGVSPRGAVSIEMLLAEGVSLAAIHAMRSANFLELRQENTVDAVDEYAELATLAGAPYVCAPRPLARGSMARVAARLRIEASAGRGARSWFGMRKKVVASKAGIQ